MAARIEDYALIGDCETAALVSREGSIDWLCVPRFDSGACFAALLGTAEHGHFTLRPAGEVRTIARRYQPDTLVLETRYTTADGEVEVIDFMPPRTRAPDLLRIATCRRGAVPMRLDLVIRFDYGAIVPWVRRLPEGHGIDAIAGPDHLRLHASVPLHGENYHTRGEFTLQEGERATFDLSWAPSFGEPPPRMDPDEALRNTQRFWRKWAGRCSYPGGTYRDAVVRSLITLKALTYHPTGGIVAAPTTSLPEELGGSRNWDYRYCWLRDATFTLDALLMAGYTEEADAWRRWLLRAVAGKPSQIQILYGLRGERRMPELELGFLPGYEGSRPVRIGNGAAGQLQLDVFGELLDSMHQARLACLCIDEEGWFLQRALVEHLTTIWDQPDEGIWEVRGPRRPFTHSRVMAWVALDRAIQAIERFGLDCKDGMLARWCALRHQIHEQVCRRGFDPKLGSFVQSYGSQQLDASLLLLPLVGFLPIEDPRVKGTVAAIERRLLRDGLVIRYTPDESLDGLPGEEGAFLACSFWLVDNYVLLGRMQDAHRLFARLLALCNDVGLLSEEYDWRTGRLTGNFPQAFSHVGLVNSARNLTQAGGPAVRRAHPEGPQASRPAGP